MVISKTVIKNNAMEGPSAADTLTKANKELLEGNREGMFVTVWLGILGISTGKLDYASAGHNPPLIETEGNGFQYLKKNSGFILAGMETTKYKGFETTLHKGDKILLYTDGVTEAMNEEKKQYGEERLKNLLDEGKTADPMEAIQILLDSVTDFRQNEPQSDDITLLALRYNGVSAPSLLLPATKENFDQFAEYMEKRFAEEKVPSSLNMKMQIVLDELYSNAVTHSQAKTFELSVRTEDKNLILQLKFDGSLFDVTKKADPDITKKAEEREAGGLGLLIVKKSVDRMEYAVEEDRFNVITLTKSF
ncbi:MAG: SpoIIE family protein phosphatase [Bacilli bacterium]|jgi:sigma-B regulation protein RsbU (phosphoserine phosphatase)|nr:SpoIIE family protein phosphatase [Bacilli bacterium]